MSQKFVRGVEVIMKVDNYMLEFVTVAHLVRLAECL